MIIGIDASRAFVDGRTGTENYSFNLITEMLRLPEAKPHTFVLFTRPNAILPKELAGYSNVIIKCVKWKYLWTQVGLAWETYQKFTIHNLQFSIDVLWVPAHTLPVLRRPGLKTVVTIHGLEYQWLREYKNLLQRWYLPLSTIYATKQADKLIAVSQFTADQLQKELHTNPKKIKVIHEGVDIEQRTRENRISKDQVNKLYSTFNIQHSKYILFVGTIQPRKNLVALIEAFSHFASGYSRDTVSDYKLVIAGGTGWMAEEVFKAPERYGVQENVIFTGRVSEGVLEELYKSALLYVQPSITEGFGLPVLEAMKAGIPVVSSNGGALPEVVGDGGVLVKLKSPTLKLQIGDDFASRLAIAMKRVASDKNLQKELISIGYERVNELSWEKAAKATFKVLVG